MSRKNSLKKLAGFLGIASVSSLISLPVLAQMNVTPRTVSLSVSQGLDIAQNTPGTTGETGGSMNTPNNSSGPATDTNIPENITAPAGETNAPGRLQQGGGTNTPERMRQGGGSNTPSNTNGPAGEMNTPGTMQQRQGEGSNTPGTMQQRQGEGSNTPGTMQQRQGEGSNTPGTMQQRQGEGSNTPGTMQQRQGEGSNTPGTMQQRQGEGSNTPGTRNAPARGTNNPARGNSQSSLSTADKDFVMKAAQDNLAEIQLGQLAAEKATSDAVKEFGQMMVEHHTQATQELTQLARQKGLTLPTDMGEENRAKVERLSKLSGREFDSAYMQEMVNAHTEDVSLFQSQTQQGQAQDLKAWAAQKLPLLQEHLQMARSMTPEG
ncbi:DUF4142 domain-containing protein [Microcoleus sp. FACHB-672]|uniref:DUF4142 domain-containing protein n=1 Tax=Microcoleus sp. FACHB-672 TaxID=2692825 RepID=UPI001685071D|nr:DUF4142 domain-containing protein [Microcoleus sp. FACHB-672]MBD2041728.1 DUF4142 domain-containing protein [Microcoleus sp. FACHB-672]